MPEGFSFQGDIAPMRGSFFQSGLSSREGSYLAKKYGPDMDDMKDMLTIQSRLAAIRNSDLAYQSNLEDLQNRRDKAARERDLESRIPDLISQVQGIRGTEEDPSTQAKKIAELQLQNPYLANTTLGSKVIAAASSSVNARAQEIAKRENKEKEERTKYMNTLKPYIETGGVDQVVGIIDADDVRTADEIEALNLAQYNRDRAQQIGAQERGVKQRDAFIKKQDSLVTSGYKALDNIKYTNGEEGPPISTANGSAAAPTLTPESRRDLERVLARLEQKSLKEIRERKLADDDLQDALYERTYEAERSLQQIQFPSQNQNNNQDTPQRPTQSQWE